VKTTESQDFNKAHSKNGGRGPGVPRGGSRRNHRPGPWESGAVGRSSTKKTFSNKGGPELGRKRGFVKLSYAKTGRKN